jgi:hypothetical protein
MSGLAVDKFKFINNGYPAWLLIIIVKTKRLILQKIQNAFIMQTVKYLLIFAILFASCRASRNAAALSTPEPTTQPVLVAAIHSTTTTTTQNTPIENPVQQNIVTENTAAAAVPEAAQAVAEKKTPQKTTSFTQFKSAAQSGKIAMSKRDMKTLNKLEKHYKGDYQKFRSDVFEFTTKAKIIAGIGLLGLLLAIFAGSGFGLFLFILALLAFILRYLDVIAF